MMRYLLLQHVNATNECLVHLKRLLVYAKYYPSHKNKTRKQCQDFLPSIINDEFSTALCMPGVCNYVHKIKAWIKKKVKNIFNSPKLFRMNGNFLGGWHILRKLSLSETPKLVKHYACSTMAYLVVPPSVTQVSCGLLGHVDAGCLSRVVEVHLDALGQCNH